MIKRALIIGIDDYSVQSQHDSQLFQLTWPTLQNCVNDANSMYHLLIQAFDFNSEDIILLRNNRATRRNILSALRYLLSNAEAGDTVCLFYAGHGGILPATTATDNTMFYESIIPYQGDWIYDFRLHQLAGELNSNEVNFTVILDSCHSGGLHSSDSIEQSLPRTIPFHPDVANIIQHMQTVWPFGICLPNDSNELIPNVSNVQIENNHLIDLDEDPNKTLIASARSTLISACKFYESAGDGGSLGHGLLTQAFLDIVNSSHFEIAYDELIQRLVSRVHTLSGNQQTPQLRGQQSRMDEFFLQGWKESV